MDLAYVLVHSPSVGPLTWMPVAERLAGSGRTTLVPSLLGIADAQPPFWTRVAERATDVIEELPAGQPIVLVAHSNAGLFVPAIVEAATRPVAACVFVDAALPSQTGPTAVAPPELLEFLRPKVTDGRLPPWTAWWDDADVAPMFPDAATRASITAEEPRLPLSYYEQQIPVPDGWDAGPCGYLLFGPPYDEIADDARRRGWHVEHVPGLHLHQIVDPDVVTGRIIAMAEKITA